MPQTRANTPLAVPPDRQYEVVANIYEDSALLQLADVRQMTSVSQEIVTAGTFTWHANMPVVTEVMAKPESTHTLANPTLTANKMATFIIVSDELLAETPVDLIAFYQDAITQRMAQLIDIHGIAGGGPFGVQNLAAAAVAHDSTNSNAMQVISGTVAAPTYVNFMDQITSVFSAVEADDYLPNGWLIARPLKGVLRGLKEGGTNQALLMENFQQDVPDQLFGEPAYFLGRGVFGNAINSPRLIVGDFSQMIVGIRDELTFSLHNEGTIGSVSLLETNQTALRAEMRLGGVYLDNKAFASLQNPSS